jgi:hypothetical protein
VYDAILEAFGLEGLGFEVLVAVGLDYRQVVVSSVTTWRTYDVN